MASLAPGLHGKGGHVATVKVKGTSGAIRGWRDGRAGSSSLNGHAKNWSNYNSTIQVQCVHGVKGECVFSFSIKIEWAVCARLLLAILIQN